MWRYVKQLIFIHHLKGKNFTKTINEHNFDNVIRTTQVLDSIIIILHGLIQMLIDYFVHDGFISSTFFQTLWF